MWGDSVWIVGRCSGAWPPKPKEGKCGKYEEFEPAHSVGTSDLMAMSVPDRCVPIMHEVTEKEWAELTERREFQDRRIDVLNFELQKLIQAAQSYQERLKALEGEKRTPPLTDMHCATVEYRPSNNPRFDDYVQGHGVDLYGCFSTKSVGVGKE